jgi:CRISPR-associated protein Cas1
MSRLTESNIVLFTCDKTHTPNGVFIPFHQHSRYTQVAHAQIAWSIIPQEKQTIFRKV